MGTRINESCKTRIISELAKVLATIRVNNQTFLDSNTTKELYNLDRILPDRGETRNSLTTNIGEFAIFGFVFDELSRELREGREFVSEVSEKLTDIDDYASPDVLAGRLVDSMETLPWNYIISLKMSDNLSATLGPHVEEIKICDQIRFTIANAEFAEKYSLSTGIPSRDTFRDSHSGKSFFAGLLPSVNHEWESDYLYLQISLDGYWGYYGETGTSKALTEMLFSFLGLGIATRLFQLKSGRVTDLQKSKLYVHKIVGRNYELQQVDSLEIVPSDTVETLELNTLDGSLNSVEQQISWAIQRLHDIGVVFSNAKRSQKLLLASQWLFRSYISEDRLLAFIQATVVLEILLGDKATSDQIGLGVLLRNRCAYLIGKSQSERENILKEFQRIYDVRSTIVHGGKNRIVFNEFVLFQKLQWMCRRVIQEEMKLLAKENA